MENNQADDQHVVEDIETFRSSHESDEHWELRKEFLMAHRNDISKDKLVCYSMVYCNMRILGCSYQKSLMKKVNKLARGLGTEFHSGRKEEEKLCKALAKLAAGKEPPNSTTSSHSKKPNKKNKKGKKKNRESSNTPASEQANIDKSQPKKNAAVKNPEMNVTKETPETADLDHKKVTDAQNVTTNPESTTKRKSVKDKKVANEMGQRDGENKENKDKGQGNEK